MGITELEKKAIKLEGEFERAPSFQRQKELNNLWDQINQLYLQARNEEQNNNALS